jgi:protein-disulfide isomerase
MAKKTETKSKRQVIKEQRAKRQKQQRLVLILVIAGAALIVAALLIVPPLLRASAPVGEVIPITPVARPQANANSEGDTNAPVLVEVWSDFQCPACRIFAQEIEPRIVQNYVATGKALYVYRQYPFIDDNSVTKESDQAANASMCAADQNRFWDYHDILFANWNGENAGSFADKRLVAFAQALGLDMNKFNTCFKANTFKAQINKDLQDGIKAGVNGTPSVFVNGQLLTPGKIPSYEEVAAAIDTALASSGN